MIDHRTTSILQRVPVILAVTASSYGLPAQAQLQRPGAVPGSVVASPAMLDCIDAIEARETSH